MSLGVVAFLVLKIFFWLMVIYGFTQIITDSSLFAPLRNLVEALPIINIFSKFLSCFLCVSVWASFVLSWMIWSPSGQFFISEYNFFLDGMFGSAVLWFFRMYENKLSNQ